MEHNTTEPIPTLMYPRASVPPSKPPEPPPPSKPPKKRLRRFLLWALVVLGSLIILGGIISALSGGNDTTPKPAAPSSGVSQGLGAKDATADVQLSSITFDEIGLGHVTATITNHSADTSDYYIEAGVFNDQGVRIDSGNAYVSHLAPNQVAKQDLTTTVQSSAHPAKVVLTQVQRTSSS